MSQTLQLHYAPWLAIIETFEQEQVTIGEQEFAVVYLSEVDLAIGLDLQLLRILHRLRGTDDDTLSKEILSLLPREVVRPSAFGVQSIGSLVARIGRDALFLGVGRSWEIDADA